MKKNFASHRSEIDRLTDSFCSVDNYAASEKCSTVKVYRNGVTRYSGYRHELCTLFHARGSGVRNNLYGKLHSYFVAIVYKSVQESPADMRKKLALKITGYRVTYNKRLLPIRWSWFPLINSGIAIR